MILTEQAREHGVLVPQAQVTRLRGRTTFLGTACAAPWPCGAARAYLGVYRGVGPVRRSLLLGYQAASFGLPQAGAYTRRPLCRALRRR